MRIFIYEFITGGGTFASPDTAPPSGSFLREGTAMLRAAATDFAAIDGMNVDVLRDARLPPFKTGADETVVRSEEEAESCFKKLATVSDATLVIAPEFDGILYDYCRLVEDAGGKLLGPSSSLVELASDKTRMADHLASAGIPVPVGAKMIPGRGLPDGIQFPVVIKPNDGAGSVDVKHIETRSEFEMPSKESRVESFCPGTAVSVALLCGPREQFTLPPCAQRLSSDGRFQYRGGQTPIDQNLAERATRLASTVGQHLPGALGYVGIDMVLGGTDVVVEVNPRLTTSYVGLRAFFTSNLAEAMLQIATGTPCELEFAKQGVSFDADGTVTRV